MKSFQKEIEDIINKCCMENKSDTPDFILAAYLSACLKAFGNAVKDRDKWYGVDLHPGCGIAEKLSEVKK